MHDRNRTPLSVGDIVTIRCRIAEIFATPDYCNVRLDYGFEGEHGAANVTGSISAINTRQTLLVEAAPRTQGGRPDLTGETPPAPLGANELDAMATRLWEALDGDQGPLALDLAMLLGAARDHECANCEMRRLAGGGPPPETTREGQ